jgi:predicted transcriptional regulator of viral defense system
MPARAVHLPTHRERIALLQLHDRGELPLKELRPVARATLAKMVAKNWIERVGPGTYRITPAGKAALKAKLPVNSSNR